MRRTFLAVAFVLSTAAVACGGDGHDPRSNADVICDANVPVCVDPEDTTYTGTPPTPFFPTTATAEAEQNAAATPGAAEAAAGPCSTPRPHAAGDSNGSVTSGGLEHTYILHIPPAYTGDAPLPLVINFHGFGSNARDQANYSGLPAHADDEGFIVVSPNGTGSPQRWTFPGLGSVDEVAFVGDLLDKLEAELCIDSAQVYAAGMSNGAAITTFIACGLPDRITAIGAVAGPRACGTSDPTPKSPSGPPRTSACRTRAGHRRVACSFLSSRPKR